MLESELKSALSPDPEYLHRIFESHDSVIDPESGIIIEEATAMPWPLDRITI